MTTEVKSESAKKNEDWMNTKWRPAMGWMYMLVCITDFVIFPVLWSLVQVVGDGKVESQWQPITLQGAGLFHIAMGAILGIAAYGRTQEKMAGANNGGLQLPTPSPSFGAPVASAPSFGGAPLGGNSVSTVPSFGAPVPKAAPASAFGAPVQPAHPEI
jgi:hypothetical protein